jgi:hypothetical protein
MSGLKAGFSSSRRGKPLFALLPPHSFPSRPHQLQLLTPSDQGKALSSPPLRLLPLPPQLLLAAFPTCFSSFSGRRSQSFHFLASSRTRSASVCPLVAPSSLNHSRETPKKRSFLSRVRDGQFCPGRGERRWKEKMKRGRTTVGSNWRDRRKRRGRKGGE